MDALAASYAQAGYRPGRADAGQPAGLLPALAGAERARRSVVPLNPDLRPAELDYLVAHSGWPTPSWRPAARATLRSAAARHAALAGVVPESPAASRARRPAPRRRTDRPRTECALLYTSGTTGKPKGCVLSNDYFLARRPMVSRAGGLARSARAPSGCITPLPMVHMNAMAFSTMRHDDERRLHRPARPFPSATWWDSVRESGPPSSHYLGVMPSMLLARAAGRDRPRITPSVSASAPAWTARITRCSRSGSASRCSKPGR